MELLGRKLTVEETIGFIRTISTESSAGTGCKEENCLVMQAAINLADEVERLQKDTNELREEVIGGCLYEGKKLHTEEVVRGYLMLRPNDPKGDLYYLVSPSGREWHEVDPGRLRRIKEKENGL